MKKTYLPTAILLMIFAAIQISCQIGTKEYKEALSIWEAGKKAHNNSYEFTLSSSSWTGYRQSTTFTVKEGKVVKRAFEESGAEVGDYQHENWVEEGADLGTHERGKKLMTMDDIYTYAKTCINMKKNEDGHEVEVSFKKDTAGIISTIGYVPNGCADDCFRGYHIYNFKWLD